VTQVQFPVESRGALLKYGDGLGQVSPHYLTVLFVFIYSSVYYSTHLIFFNATKSNFLYPVPLLKREMHVIFAMLVLLRCAGKIYGAG
jgi:hypothetical protein